MSKLGDQIRALRSLSYKRIEVPAWGEEGKPLVIYSTPFTIADLKKISKHAKKDPTEALVYTVIFKALDERGNPAFDIEDKQWLMTEESSDVLSDVVNQMNESEGFEEKLKNS